MIESKNKKVWTTSDGTEHESIEAAKCHEIVKLAADNPLQDQASFPIVIAEWIVANSEALLAILRSRARKPRASKVGRPKGSKNKVVTSTTPAA